MSQCSVCQHPKRQDIEYDRHHGVALAAVAVAYDVHHLAVWTHMRLHVASVPRSDSFEFSDIQEERARAMVEFVTAAHSTGAFPDDALPVTENPLRQFTRAIDTAADAYQLAQDDPQMQAHMRERLQEKIKFMVQAED